MQLKNPGGGIAWTSAYWMLVGGFVGINEFIRGNTQWGFLGLILFLCGSVVWLDIRQVAWPLMIWFGFVVLCGALVLVLKGLSVRTLVSVFMAGLTIYELKEWRDSE